MKKNLKIISIFLLIFIKIIAAKNDIILNGIKYCSCEFGNLAKFEDNVKDYKKIGNPEFHVISDQNLNVANYMRDPKNNGAIFQIAANDNLLWTWACGGAQAGSVIEATELGAFIRNSFSNKTLFEKNLKDNLLPYNLGTSIQASSDINNILVATFSNLAIKGVKNQTVNIPFVAAFNGKVPVENVRNCLKVAYNGTLLSAISLGEPKVFLTLMGAGVFQNPVNEIIDAIKTSVKLYVKKYGLNVTILYRGKDESIIKLLRSIEKEIQ